MGGACEVICFCEAPADFQIASELIDRVLRERGQTWLAETLDVAPDGVRRWIDDGGGRSFFNLHRCDAYARQFNVRVPHGHFDSKPGAPGALMGRTVFQIGRRLSQRCEGPVALVLVWDMDQQPVERRAGLEQARVEARSYVNFAIVLGSPNAMREAWVLAGFEPATDDERAQLAVARQELGFAPNEAAHRLDAADEQAKTSAKRVLRILVQDPDREAQCWRETPLEQLQKRSASTGLREFLSEIETELLPLVLR